MKKSIITACICFLAIVSFGQSSKGIWLGVHGSFGAGKLLPAEINIHPNRMVSKIQPQYDAGIELGYMFNRRLGLLTGLGISHYTYEFGPSWYLPPPLEISITGATTYLNLPLGVRFVFMYRDNYTFFFNAGGRAGLLINGKTQYAFRNLSAISYYGTRTDRASDLQSYGQFTMFSFLHLGINLPVGKWHLSIGPEVSYQLMNLLPYPYGYIPYDARSALHNSSYYGYGDDWQANYFHVALKVNVSRTNFN